ncbi:hypothetical protein [Ekhidna sp.]|uniref:hypothetical protein n=1 Tax=Ekhidna sp. TaxID=2608089 RepID=UPI003BAADDCE
MKRSTYLILTAILTSLSINAQSLKKEDLYGSYTLKEINYIYTDTTIQVSPSQDGFFILSPRRYAIAYNPGLNPRKPFGNLSSPSEEEILAGFRSFAFNSGSYRFEDGVFTASPDFAKVPGFEGGEQVYATEVEGAMLHLSMYDETYPSGEKPAWFKKLVIKLSFQKEVAP